MATALFINGIYDEVLTEILNAQKVRGGGNSFLQPYSGKVVAMLRKQRPSPETPIRLYVSTTKNLSKICCTGQIVGWEDKRELSPRRRREVRRYLEEYQPGEVNLFTGVEEVGERAVNLITIRELKQLDSWHSVTLLTKVSDGTPYKVRTQSGGWSEVYDLGDLIDLPTEPRERYDSELALAIEASNGLSNAALRKRLSSAARFPEKVQVISVAYRRNPDVIVAVLRRANGVCERCGSNAPFQRRSDGSPYLEVHHWTPLRQGGEDTIDNSAALCPNCHRKVHHGQTNGEQGDALERPIGSDLHG